MQYFFQLELGNDKAGLAMIAPFSPVDANLHAATFGVLSVCYAQPHLRRVIQVKDITAVVAMFPKELTAQERAQPDAHELAKRKFYVGEKPGLEFATLQGYMEPDGEDEEDDNVGL